MIQEAYVSFETAKLLKEKGFDGECMSMYVTPKPHAGMGNPNEAKIAPHGRDSHYYDGYLYQCEAPTLQMAMRWLREVHNIFLFVYPHFKGNVEIEPDKTSYWEFNGWSGKPMILKEKMFNIIGLDEVSGVFGSYEEVCEAGIKYCLENLIEKR